MEWIPNKIERPSKVLDVPSAWIGLESVIGDVISRLEIKNESAIEFGVECGYSIVALSNFFDHVLGIDTFEGDKDAGFHKDPDALFSQIKERLFPYSNIVIQKKNFRDFFTSSRYDLAHIDIAHTYEDTFDCGDKILQHCDTVLFHDTVSFPDVSLAVSALASKYEMNFYNYSRNNGLGILTSRSLK